MTLKDCLRRHTILKCLLITATLLTCVAYLHQLLSPVMKILLALGGVEILIDLFKGGFSLRCKKAWILVLFAAAYVITAYFEAGDSSIMIRGVKNALYMLMVFLICYAGSADDEAICKAETRIITNVAVVSMLAMEIACLIVYFTREPSTYVTADGVTGYIGSLDGRLCGLVHMNVIGAISALTIIICAGLIICRVSGLWRLVYILSIVVSAACLALSYSRTAILALIIAIIYAFLRFYLLRKLSPKAHSRFTKAACIVMGATVLGIAVFTVITAANGLLAGYVQAGTEKLNVLLTGRVSIWREGLSMYQAAPLLGITNERFAAEAVVDTFAGWNGGGIHSIYVGTLMASGIIGAVILAAFTVCDLLNTHRSGIINKSNGVYAVASTVMVFLLAQGLTEMYLLYSLNFFGVIYWIAMGMRRQEVDNC